MFALIRHADAGTRQTWDGDDRLRPLTKLGMRQADHLARALAKAPLAEVLSSPCVRCLQTVAPLAAIRGLEVLEAAELVEGTGVADTLALFHRLAGRTVALCTHGDVVLNMCEFLVGRGLIKGRDVQGQKGGAWLLEEAGGEITAARYLSAR